MKNSVLIFLLFVLIYSTHQGHAEIKNKKALMNVFQGCVNEELPDVSAGAQFNYCGCFIKEVSQGMDFEELMTLGIDVMSAGENKQKQEKILISNQKIKKYIVKCASKLYE
tara:strand:+ start:753 stop:1085 length:333 start_codon:yes stop_codon:yes gene_type:complete